jgi:hypothetical protein
MQAGVVAAPAIKKEAAMIQDYITPDQFFNGIVWTVIIIAALFVVFLGVALVCLMAVDPKCPDHMRRLKP